MHITKGDFLMNFCVDCKYCDDSWCIYQCKHESNISGRSKVTGGLLYKEGIADFRRTVCRDKLFEPTLWVKIKNYIMGLLSSHQDSHVVTMNTSSSNTCTNCRHRIDDCRCAVGGLVCWYKTLDGCWDIGCSKREEIL